MCTFEAYLISTINPRFAGRGISLGVRSVGTGRGSLQSVGRRAPRDSMLYFLRVNLPVAYVMPGQQVPSGVLMVQSGGQWVLQQQPQQQQMMVGYQQQQQQQQQYYVQPPMMSVPQPQPLMYGAQPGPYPYQQQQQQQPFFGGSTGGWGGGYSAPLLSDAQEDPVITPKSAGNAILTTAEQFAPSAPRASALSSGYGLANAPLLPLPSTLSDPVFNARTQQWERGPATGPGSR